MTTSPDLLADSAYSNAWASPQRHTAPLKDPVQSIVEVVEALDTRAIEEAYHGGGSAPYPPKMLLALLFYCYAKGIFSSRKIERATDELIPVLYLTGGTHPDHDSINTFRQRFLPQLESLFVQILRIAHDLGILQLGDVSLDGAKIQANASKHKAMSGAYAEKLEEMLRAEVQTLLQRAETEGGQGSKEIDLPAELKRREDRLHKIAEVKAEIERRAQARYAQEQADSTAKQAERAAKEQARGRKLGGKQPRNRSPVRGPKIRSISPTKTLGSCRSRAGGSSQPTMPKPQWIWPPCSSWARTSRHTSTTNRKSSRRSRKWRSCRTTEVFLCIT